MIHVEVADEQSTHTFDHALLQEAVRVVLQGESVAEADVSVAIVDDPAIHLLNRKYLEHDYATDVLSFLLSAIDEPLEGEIIVSADTAKREANRYAWSITDELLLYVIHGTLHIIGYDDASDRDRELMRAKERAYLEKLGRSQPAVAREDSHAEHSSAEPPQEGEAKS